MVWRAGDDLELTTCPVREITDEARAYVDVFYACYRLTPAGSGGMWWDRRSLPGAGGAGEQDARTMAALDVIEAAATKALQEQRPTEHTKARKMIRQQRRRHG